MAIYYCQSPVFIGGRQPYTVYNIGTAVDRYSITLSYGATTSDEIVTVTSPWDVVFSLEFGE